KISTLPLFNSAFRQGKGTGDLFVNATYFITAGGSRRTTTFMLDGASIDEGWGRQTAITTVPLGAVQETTILTNAFSAEYGWTARASTKAGVASPPSRPCRSERCRRRRSSPTPSPPNTAGRRVRR